MLSCASCATTTWQVARVTGTFDWPADRVEILSKLIPRLVDTADRPGVRALAASVGPDTWRGALRGLGYFHLVCPENPTGFYNLNLSAPVDRMAGPDTSLFFSLTSASHSV